MILHLLEDERRKARGGQEINLRLHSQAFRRERRIIHTVTRAQQPRLRPKASPSAADSQLEAAQLIAVLAFLCLQRL